MKRIGIIGTRKRNTITDYHIIKEAFFEIYEEGDWISSGHCKSGGDAFAEKIAFGYGVPILLFPPKKQKREFFFARNLLIAKFSTIIIACVKNPHESLNDILKRTSGGTEHTLKHFRKFHPNGEIIIR